MADLSTFLNSSGYKLAPQLTGFARPNTTVTGIDVSSGATVLSLSGKYILHYLQLADMTNATSITITMAIDGTTIWNETFTSGGTNIFLIGSPSNLSEGVLIDSSFTLTVTQAGETDASVLYLARPIE